FIVNPSLVLLVAVIVKLFLPVNVPAPVHANSSRPEGPKALLPIFARLAKIPSFWFALGLSFLLTFVRTGFMTWTPRFLYEVAAPALATSPMSSSIAKCAFFGAAGMVGSLVTGRLSDKLGPGRRTPLMAGSLAILFFSTLGLAHAGVHSPVLA